MKVSLLKSIPLLVLLLVSCTEDPSSKPDDPNNSANSQLTLSVAELNYSDAGGSQAVVIRSNANWTVSGTSDWCTIDRVPDRTCNLAMTSQGEMTFVRIKGGLIYLELLAPEPKNVHHRVEIR